MIKHSPRFQPWELEKTDTCIVSPRFQPRAMFKRHTQSCHFEEREILTRSSTKIDRFSVRSYLRGFLVPRNDKLNGNILMKMTDNE